MDSNKIIKNKFVVLTYEIYDEKSEVIEKVDIPMNYIHGKGKKLLQKIEDSLEGKVAGEEIEVLIKPEDGLLVLFPSYLEHSVNPNLSNSKRIVISFNITLENYKN